MRLKLPKFFLRALVQTTELDVISITISLSKAMSTMLKVYRMKSSGPRIGTLRYVKKDREDF